MWHKEKEKKQHTYNKNVGFIWCCYIKYIQTNKASHHHIQTHSQALASIISKKKKKN